MNDPFRFESENGHLYMRGTVGRPEDPACVVCGDVIRFVLDMFSFTTGPVHGLAHARCVWTANAFLHEGMLSEEDQARFDREADVDK